MTKILNKWKISSFFEKDEKGNYTNDALLCQDILNYCLTINKTVQENNSFQLRDLQKWVVQNNAEIRQYYQGSKAHTSPANKVHAQETRINSKFEGPMQLRLIKRSIPENSSSVASLYTDKVSYEYTKGGFLLALIVKNMDLKKVIASTRSELTLVEDNERLDRNYRDIYDIFNLAYKVRKDSSAYDIFYSSLFQKCRDEGIFDKLVNRIHYTIIADTNIVNVIDLLQRAVYSPFFDRQSETEFLEVLKETVEELDHNVKKLILYRIKMVAEDKFEYEQEELTRQYEEFRYEMKSNLERIAIQGYCENCKTQQNVALHYSDLISRAQGNDLRMDCQNCSLNKTVIIPNLDY